MSVAPEIVIPICVGLLLVVVEGSALSVLLAIIIVEPLGISAKDIFFHVPLTAPNAVAALRVRVANKAKKNFRRLFAWGG